MSKRLSVLHGPANVGNQPWVLSRHERSSGADSELVVNYNTWLNYPVDRCLSPLAKKSARNVFKRLWFGASSPFRYDVFHYYFGRSFLCWDDFGPPNWLWFKDLHLARALGKKVFMTLQGCDARISQLSASRNETTMCAEGHCQARAACAATLDAQRKRLIADVLPAVNRVFILNPELVHYVPNATFLPYSNVEVDQFEPSYPTTDGPIKIVHAPSDPLIKGTRFIAEAINNLSKRFNIQYIEIKGVPHAEAMKLYRSADLVIDQVLAGWYGGFAVEAMAMGKPVACYIRDADLACLPEAMRRELPIVRVNVKSLEDDLEQALLQRQAWPEWGQRARSFVMRWHNPRKIAGAMMRAYQDQTSAFVL